jgi:hypothetical protein
METISLNKKCMSGMLWHIQAGALEAQTRNADFAQTGFTVQIKLSLLFGILQ